MLTSSQRCGGRIREVPRSHPIDEFRGGGSSHLARGGRSQAAATLNASDEGTTMTLTAPAPRTRSGRSGDGLCDLAASDLVDLLRSGRVAAVEALEAHLTRIAERNGALDAVVSLDVDRARALARSADETFLRGGPIGPLHGLPMTLKDGHDVAGLRTTIGLPAFDRLADEDGTVAARLRQAGAIVLGHSNVAAGLADHSQSANPIFGRTANPWDVDRVPGGSSGGAAAAVAAGLTPVEVGSDVVGSIRLPAHFCGVYGLKTTEHRVGLTGFYRPPPGGPRPLRIISTLGPIARDPRDLELVLGVLAGPDGHDGDVPPVPLQPEPRRPLHGLRLAVAPTVAGVRVAAGIRRRVEQVAAGAADAGAEVVEGLPALDWDAQHQLFGELLMTLTGLFDPGAEVPDERRTLAWYLDALERRDRFIAAWDGWFADVDGLILPAGTTSAFTHRGTGEPLEVDGAPAAYDDNGLLHAFADLAGLPALVAPAGLDVTGLPVGVQLVGPRWSELRLVRIVQELERVGILPGFRAPPADQLRK
jgi:amidase